MRGWGPSIVSYLECYCSTVPIVGLVQQKTVPIYPRWPDTLQTTVTTQEKRRIARVWWEHHEGERMIGSLLPSSPPRLQSISTLKSSNQPWNPRGHLGHCKPSGHSKLLHSTHHYTHLCSFSPILFLLPLRRCELSGPLSSAARVEDPWYFLSLLYMLQANLNPAAVQRQMRPAV